MYNYRLADDYNWGTHAVMMIFGFVFFVVIIYGAIALMRGAGHHDQGRHLNRTSPLDIAKARYAKGELTKAEFEQLIKDLSE